MNLYRIYIFIVYLFHPFVDELTKGGKEFREFIYACLIFVVYAHIFVFSLTAFIEYLYVFAMHELRWIFYEAYL